MNNKYRLEPSQLKSGWWVCTDTDNQLVCTFKEGRFNDTQKFTDLEGDDTFKSMVDVMVHLRIMREMSDWLAINHYKIVMG